MHSRAALVYPNLCKTYLKKIKKILQLALAGFTEMKTVQQKQIGIRS